MDFTVETLTARLEALADGAPARRYVVAFSGGADSTVLLHAAASVARAAGRPITAVHVDHGLHQESPDWARHCVASAEAMGVACRTESIRVAPDGDGLEAAARRARYGCFSRHLERGDWLLTAHHLDDQAETLLLNLVRGSGPHGLAGIAARRPLGSGYLVRPLLDVPRSALVAYAARERLQWLEDPSNDDHQHDRNFLRHELIPRMYARWPAAVPRLAHSAALASAASELLDTLAAMDLDAVGEPGRIDIARLQRFPDNRQLNLLRYAIRISGLPGAPATRLRQIVDELVPAREDAQPLVTWPGAEVRRFRNCIYLAPALSEPEAVGATLTPDRPVALGPGMGSLRLVAVAGTGIRPDVAAAGLSVGFRQGGERLRRANDDRRRRLKSLLQEAGIVPWMRGRIPLLYAQECLVSVADLWTCADSEGDGGYVVRWDDRPPLN